MKGTTVTQFIKSVKQPRGGFLKLSQFSVTRYDDGKVLLDQDDENFLPQLVGMVVDYLSRFMLTGDALAAFDISIKGATIVKKFDKAMQLVDKINGLDDASIIAACHLVKFDVAYRAGPMFYNAHYKVVPDKETINNIRILVERTVAFFKTRKGLETHITFKGAYNDVIATGDGDFADDTTIWDLKVSIKQPNPKHILQVIIYQILYNKADKGRQLTSVGFFNPRLNCSYVCNLNVMDAIDYRTLEGMVEYGSDYVCEETYGIDDVATLLRVYFNEDGKEVTLDLDGFIELVESAANDSLDPSKMQYEMVAVTVTDVINNLPEGNVTESQSSGLTGEMAYCVKPFLWKINGDYFVDYGYFEKLFTVFKLKKGRINRNFRHILVTKNFLVV